jgi:hypothetical protein
MKQRYGYCQCHNRLSSLNSKGLCPEGAKERRKHSAESKGIVQSVVGKKTAIKQRTDRNKELVRLELLMFKKIWETRPHFCEVTGKPLGAFDIRMFSHVLTKGAYPRFRLYEKNIVLCLPEAHFEWEFKTRKTLELSWIETLESALKTEYYKLN